MTTLFISKRHLLHASLYHIQLLRLLIRDFQLFDFLALTLQIVGLSLLKGKIRNLVTFTAAVVLAELLYFIEFENQVIVDQGHVLFFNLLLVPL